MYIKALRTGIRTGALLSSATLTLLLITPPATVSAADEFAFHRDGGFYQGRDWNHPHLRAIPWSYASDHPRVPRGQATGFFIWHDRNTVHVESTDNRWFGDQFRGRIEIQGGKFDNVKEEHDRDDTRFRQTGPNQLIFAFDSHRSDVTGFKFNIHGGSRLILHIGMDAHPTGRIFYGKSKTPSGEDPVIFDLNR